MTASCRRITFARICIEVEAELELLKNLTIEVEDPLSGEVEHIHLQVEYQWLPLRCARCKKFGHNCEKLLVSQGVVKKENLSQSQVQEGQWLVKNKGKTIIDTNQENPSEDNIPFVESAKRTTSKNINLLCPQVVEETQPSSPVHMVSSAVSKSNQFSLLAEEACDPEVEEVTQHSECPVSHEASHIEIAHGLDTVSTTQLPPVVLLDDYIEKALDVPPPVQIQPSSTIDISTLETNVLTETISKGIEVPGPGKMQISPSTSRPYSSPGSTHGYGKQNGKRSSHSGSSGKQKHPHRRS